MNRLFSFLTAGRFWMHLMLILVFLAIAAFLAMSWLDYYTRHGESISVPDLHGKSIADVENLLENNDLVYIVTDSVYSDDVERGVVVTQNPKAGKSVKRGRTVFLTVNSFLPELVSMPDLMGKSLRIAVPLLEISGLKLKTLEYVPDESCTDCVLGYKLNDDELEAGDRLRKGESITLILGKQSREETLVPRLLGMQYRDAKEIIMAHSLNVGQVLLCTDCSTDEDTAYAYVINQIPKDGEDANLGSYVDVFLSTDSLAAKAFELPKDSLDYEND